MTCHHGDWWSGVPAPSTARRPSNSQTWKRRFCRGLRPNAISSYVDPRALPRVGLRLPEHFPGHGRGVAFAEREELQEIRDRVAFGPPEVCMRYLPRLVADEQQQRRDGVRDRG